MSAQYRQIPANCDRGAAAGRVACLADSVIIGDDGTPKGLNRWLELTAWCPAFLDVASNSRAGLSCHRC